MRDAGERNALCYVRSRRKKGILIKLQGDDQRQLGYEIFERYTEEITLLIEACHFDGARWRTIKFMGTDEAGSWDLINDRVISARVCNINSPEISATQQYRAILCSNNGAFAVHRVTQYFSCITEK